MLLLQPAVATWKLALDFELIRDFLASDLLAGK